MEEKVNEHDIKRICKTLYGAHSGTRQGHEQRGL